MGPSLRQPPQRPTATRVELRHGDAAVIEVVEDGDHVRLTVYDDEHEAIPLIAALLSRDERRKLVAALVGVDIAHRA